MLNVLSCATALGATIPSAIPSITSTVVNIIKFVVPVLLIIFGMLDLGKAVVAQKEDEIKKGQQTFFKRAIAAVIVFFVFAIVQLVVGVVANAAGDDSSNISSCISCFINNSDC